MHPRPVPEAYLRLRTLPREQAQVDWGHFGHQQIGRARRPLMAFVMVPSYSRRIFLRFFLDAHGATFIRGYAEASVEVDYGKDEITGVSMIDGSHPTSCSLRFCGVRKLSVKEVWSIKRFGPTDGAARDRVAADKRWW